MKKWFKTLAVAAFGLGTVAMAQAQSASTGLGEFEYMNSCAHCHGADGKGGGTIVAYLNTPLPDWSQLQKENGGVFPVSKVFQSIELGPEPGPHGTADMPAWGQRYFERAATDPYFMTNAADFPKLRILALIEYLTTIQE